MKKVLLKIGLTFFKIFAISSAHFFISLFTPFPISKINIIFVLLVLFFLKNEKGSLIWVEFAIYFIIELYTIYPFGITISSATLAFLLGYWIFNYFFTNRTWYTAVALVTVMLLIYRVTFIFLLIIYHLNVATPMPAWSSLAYEFSLEILISAIASGVLFILLTPLVDDFQRQKIFTSWFKNIKQNE
jgi:hypothetical protein